MTRLQPVPRDLEAELVHGLPDQSTSKQVAVLTGGRVADYMHVAKTLKERLQVSKELPQKCQSCGEVVALAWRDAGVRQRDELHLPVAVIYPSVYYHGMNRYWYPFPVESSHLKGEKCTAYSNTKACSSNCMILPKNDFLMMTTSHIDTFLPCTWKK